MPLIFLLADCELVRLWTLTLLAFQNLSAQDLAKQSSSVVLFLALQGNFVSQPAVTLVLCLLSPGTSFGDYAATVVLGLLALGPPL